jgi:uncharacterized protein (DUF608 family)
VSEINDISTIFNKVDESSIIFNSVYEIVDKFARRHPEVCVRCYSVDNDEMFINMKSINTYTGYNHLGYSLSHQMTLRDLIEYGLNNVENVLNKLYNNILKMFASAYEHRKELEV